MAMSAATLSSVAAAGVSIDEAAKAAAESDPISHNNNNIGNESHLRKHYDVVLCGTGLVQSILASALARAGKTILHCDAHNTYGELQAVWTLAQFEEECHSFAKEEAEATMRGCDEKAMRSNGEGAATDSCIPLHPRGALSGLQMHSVQRKKDNILVAGSPMATPYGSGVLTSDPQDASLRSLQISLNAWTLADGNYPKLYVGFSHDDAALDSLEERTVYLAQTCGILHQQAQRAQTILHPNLARFFHLDVSPGLLYASGSAVQGLLTSGVADYLEFKSLEGLYWCNNNNGAADLQPVPCSKHHVFGSKLLSPLDKRRLMKFLQLALDYSLAQRGGGDGDNNDDDDTGKDDTNDSPQPSSSSSSDEQHVQQLNERHLNQGRSLARPQNKALATNDLALLDDCLDLPFAEFLQQRYQLSPPLALLVRYALALETTTTTTTNNNNNNSNGSSSTTATTAATTTTTRTGMAQLCQHVQALGRFGVTAFLVPLYGSGELPQAFCRSAAVYGATYLLRRAAVQVDVVKAASERQSGSNVPNNNMVVGVVLANDAENETANKSSSLFTRVSCSHVVLPQAALLPRREILSTTTGRVLRRLCILRGKLLGPHHQQQQQQRHVVIFPPQSIGNTNVIHALLLDEQSHVAPHVPGGCSVVHLTTVGVDDNVDDDDDDEESVLKRAMQTLLRIANNGAANDEVDEIFHAEYSYPLFDRRMDEEETAADVSGLYIVRGAQFSLTLDAAFEEAATLFERICPGEKFLALAQQVTDAIKERLGADRVEDDDEGLVLESAMGMIQKMDARREEASPSE